VPDFELCDPQGRCPHCGNKGTIKYLWKLAEKTGYFCGEGHFWLNSTETKADKKPLTTEGNGERTGSPEISSSIEKSIDTRKGPHALGESPSNLHPKF
jgi:hypothetical protein